MALELTRNSTTDYSLSNSQSDLKRKIENKNSLDEKIKNAELTQKANEELRRQHK